MYVEDNVRNVFVSKICGYRLIHVGKQYSSTQDADNRAATSSSCTYSNYDPIIIGVVVKFWLSLVF